MAPVPGRTLRCPADTGFAIGSIVRLQVPRVCMANGRALGEFAMPLLFQLREDQKREVRSLAHIIGLGSVASLI